LRSQVRAEIRHYIDARRAEQFKLNLFELMSLNSFPNPVNQTLYFNNKEHEVPFTYSIRGRRYQQQPFKDHFKLKPSDKWIFEVKNTRSEHGRFIRHKRRNEMLPLREILTRVKRMNRLGRIQIPHRLSLYAGASYRRNHFLESDRGVRVTMDQDVRYFTFQDLTGMLLGASNKAIVELKIPPGRTSIPLVRKIQGLLRKENAEQGISKKATIFNLIEEKAKRLGDAYKEPSHNTEIKAKIALDAEDQSIFPRVRTDLAEGKIEGFRPSKSYSSVMETGKLYHYVQMPAHEYVRFETSGQSRSATIKENFQVVQDPFRLGNVIKRREIEEPIQPDMLRLPYKILTRRRKYFMVERDGRSREYAVMMDRSTHRGHELYQLEVEDVLRSPSQRTESRSINDVASLANYLIEEYSLEPTTLTKNQWLMSLPN
jgi:hypothetical protein